MAYYRKQRTPAQIAALELKRKIATAKRISVLKAYALAWKDPVEKPKMEARAACGRLEINANQTAINQALQRFLQKQPPALPRGQWLDKLMLGADDICRNARQIRPGYRPTLRAKNEANLFRTLVRKGYLKLNLSSLMYDNQCFLMP